MVWLAEDVPTGVEKAVSVAGVAVTAAVAAVPQAAGVQRRIGGGEGHGRGTRYGVRGVGTAGPHAIGIGGAAHHGTIHHRALLDAAHTVGQHVGDEGIPVAGGGGVVSRQAGYCRARAGNGFNYGHAQGAAGAGHVVVHSGQVFRRGGGAAFEAAGIVGRGAGAQRQHAQAEVQHQALFDYARGGIGGQGNGGGHGVTGRENGIARIHEAKPAGVATRGAGGEGGVAHCGGCRRGGERSRTGVGIGTGGSGGTGRNHQRVAGPTHGRAHGRKQRRLGVVAVEGVGSEVTHGGAVTRWAGTWPCRCWCSAVPKRQ